MSLSSNSSLSSLLAGDITQETLIQAGKRSTNRHMEDREDSQVDTLDEELSTGITEPNSKFSDEELTLLYELLCDHDKAGGGVIDCLNSLQASATEGIAIEDGDPQPKQVRTNIILAVALLPRFSWN